MELALESVLKKRSLQLNARLQRRRSIVLSLSLHLFILSSFVIVRLLSSKEVAPIEFTPVTIVPVQALGVPEPVTPAPRQEVQRTPDPEPLPKKVETEPEKSPAKEPTRQPQTKATTESSPPSTVAPQEALGQRQGSALGSSLGSSAFGAAVGGLDNPDFVYGYYVDQMLAMIGTNWQRPSLGADVEAVVHFRIHRDGHISNLRVAKSSGYNSFDLAGLRAVQLAVPFPKLPQSFKHGSLGVNLILR